MNIRFAFPLFSLLLVAGFAQGSELSGVYVNKNDDSCRIEFQSNGRYIASDPKHDGAYTIDKDTCICRSGEEEKYRFRIEGDSLIDAENNEWIPRETLAKMPWKEVSPVTVAVLDHDTGKPVPRYLYTYEIRTPKASYDPLWVQPKEVNSPKGEFTVQAPASCEIYVSISGHGVVGGFGQGGGSYPLTTKNKLRRIEVSVNVGDTIEGVVVDAKTGKPIKDAVVSPIRFFPPLFTADRERGIKTDADGKFVIDGVDYRLGISVWHPQYFEFNPGGFQKTGKKIGDKHYATKIELQTGETLLGVVRDTAGKPLPGVEVSDGAGKTDCTNRDGEFILASPTKCGGQNDAYRISFKKEGFLDKTIYPKSADPKGFAITLEPQPLLTGHVIAPDGRPVNRFLVAAGVGLEPPVYCCWDSKADIRDPQGRFSLRVDTGRDWDKVGKVWVGVKSPDFALWETTIDIWKKKTAIIARLKPGVSVFGSVAGRKDRNDTVAVTLLPCRTKKTKWINPDELSMRQTMGQMKTTADASGKFCFNHVAPGDYQLFISGPKISPIESTLSVSDKDVDVGKFGAVGTGSLSGLVYEPKFICEGGVCRLDEKRKPWKFVEGFISRRDPAGRGPSIRFKTDEHGRFQVSGVPVGVVELGIHYHLSADILGTHSRRANVVEGKTTEVRFFDPSGDWKVSCKPVIGDGSPAQYATGTGMAAKRKVAYVTARPPMFNVELIANANAPRSFGTSSDWQALDGDKPMLLSDVQPGKYRLVVRDWQGSMGLHGVVFKKDIETVNGGTKLVIPLGNCSMTGNIQWTKPYRMMVHVIAIGKRTGTIRHAYADEDGNFCTRYLPNDEYQLFAHDHDAGWCKLPKTRVENNTVDIGTHTLTPGGTISGNVPARWAMDQSVSVTAVDSHGIPIQNPNRYEPVGKNYAISNIWPGKWTVKLIKDDQVIAEKVVELRGDETQKCDFAEP